MTLTDASRQLQVVTLKTTLQGQIYHLHFKNKEWKKLYKLHKYLGCQMWEQQAISRRLIEQKVTVL